MTGNNKREIITVLAIAAFLFVVVVPAFWFTAHRTVDQTKNPPLVQVPAQKEQGTLKDGDTALVTLGALRIRGEIVASPERRAQGLSGRSPFGVSDGMLFVFERGGIYSFWNKDMLFPLDLVWIDGDTVVDIYENLPAFGAAPVVYTPEVLADKVLEVSAGVAASSGIKKGDKVTIEHVAQ